MRSLILDLVWSQCCLVGASGVGSANFCMYRGSKFFFLQSSRLQYFCHVGDLLSSTADLTVTMSDYSSSHDRPFSFSN